MKDANWDDLSTKYWNKSELNKFISKQKNNQSINDEISNKFNKKSTKPISIIKIIENYILYNYREQKIDRILKLCNIDMPINKKSYFELFWKGFSSLL